MDKEDKSNKHHRNILNILFLFAAIFTLLSLLTYSRDDFHLLSGGLDIKYYSYQNWCGIIGASLSHYLFLIFGWIIVLINIFFIIDLSVGIFMPVESSKWDTFFGYLALLFGLSVLIGIYPECISNPVSGNSLEGTNALAGGMIGVIFSAPNNGLFYKFSNTGGCMIISAMCIITSIYFLHKEIVNVYRCLRKIPLKRKLATAEVAAPIAEQVAASGKTIKLVPKEDPVLDSGSAFSNLTVKQRQSSIDNKPVMKQPVLFDDKIDELPPVAVKSKIATAPKAPVKTAKQKPVMTASGEYTIPSINLLEKASASISAVNQSEIDHKILQLQDTLSSFRINAEVVGTISGPRVTLFELRPEAGINLSKFKNIQSNIAMNLEAHSMRLLTPIPGKNTVGIEIPNSKSAPVNLRPLLEEHEWVKGKSMIPLALGRDIGGKSQYLDLARAPHLLIAGATGSGKSVCMNTIIASMLFRFSPEELKLILVDPKVVEFKNYEKLPHLVTPVINDPKKVTLALHWATKEMDKRYRILSQAGVKNIASYNSRPAKEMFQKDGTALPKKMPYLVIIIDELADIMMTAKGDVETLLARIAQLGRASGIHAIIATQRPSTNVITGVIKANFPTWIAFQVSSGIDSRVILEDVGAKDLLGQGDMLFNPPGVGQLLRLQGAYVPDRELDHVVNFVSNQIPQQFDEAITYDPEEDFDGDMTPSPGFTDDDIEDALEPLVKQSIEVIKKDGKVSISYLQRRLGIGYNKSATIVDKLEELGIVGPPYGGGQKRDILIPTDKDS